MARSGWLMPRNVGQRATFYPAKIPQAHGDLLGATRLLESDAQWLQPGPNSVETAPYGS